MATETVAKAKPPAVVKRPIEDDDEDDENQHMENEVGRAAHPAHFTSTRNYPFRSLPCVGRQQLASLIAAHR